MIKTTQWSPDTCQCIVQYSWDDSLASSSRNHTLSSFISKCSAHSSLDDTTAFNALTQENSGKNQALDTLAKNYQVLVQTVNGLTGNSVVLAPGKVAWAFDKNRNLTISIPSFSATQIAAAQALLATRVPNLTINLTISPIIQKVL